METSTPINSPNKNRKKHSLVQKFVPVDESLGDIESEIQSRRLEAINKSTEGRRRLSAAPLLAGYTASQLTQHCRDVIKLSTENKINCKNAFNFWLIDVMAAMAKKTDSEINKNFQVASCTLDASVKIYGYRVDAIHTDAVKIAGGFFSKDVQAIDDDDNGDDIGKKEDENGEAVANKAKKKKKKKKLTIVLAESLNAKSEAEVLLNVIPKHNFLSRKTDGNDLLVKIPKINDGGLLALDSEYPCWPYDSNDALVPKFENKDIFDHNSLLSLISGISVSKYEDLCSSYSKFEFGRACQSDNSDDELQMSQNSGKFEFHMDEIIHNISTENSEPEDQRNRINIPVGGYNSDQDIVVVPERQKKICNIAISDLKSRISINPSEYSMFDEKMLKAWAGPSHWKVKMMRKPLEDFSNNDSKPIASKRTRKGKIKSLARLFDVVEKVLEKNLTECEKTTLFKSTMLNWNVQNTTIPKDLKCQSKNLFSLYHIPSMSVWYKNNENEPVDVSDQFDDNQVRDVNVEESEYCSAPVIDNNYDSHHTDEEINLEGGCGDDAWDSGNMVEAPNKVEKVQKSAFKRRKYIDIKQLKYGLWNYLTKSEEENEKLEESVEFNDLVKLYPSKVPKNFGCTLNAPLIFNALLHLTNEKGLVLTQDKLNKFNFVISQ